MYNIQMADIVFKNLEQLLPYMVSSLSLSRTDETFLESLSSFAASTNRVTTNQDALLKRIIEKYARQFAKKEYFTSDLIALPWSCQVVPSSPVYTEPHVSIDNHRIVLRAPFNKNFIKATRQNPIYSMVWNRDEKHYELNYNTLNLRELVGMVKDHYPSVNFCPITSELLYKVHEYAGAKYWTPTLICINDRLLIAAANQPLIDALGDMELKCDLAVLATLVSHGIDIDSSVIELLLNTTSYSAEQIAFSISHSLTLEISEIPNVIYWLKELGCTGIYDTGRTWRSSEKTTVVNALDTTKIPCTTISASGHNKLTDEKPVVFTFKMFGTLRPTNIRAFKEIRFVNSQPITLTEK
jgi:hypothetical protein